MTQENLATRISGLEQRLAAIEQRLGIAAPAPTVREASTPTPPAMPVAPALRAAPPPLPAQPVAESIPMAQVATVPPAQPAPTIQYQAPAIRPSAVREGSLEQTIGLKWAGWIGAVVLVIAMGLGIKFGYDNGWFGVVPDGVKLLLMWLGGFALIGLGEIVYRRINKISAAGLYGAGVATLFLVSFAGFGFYKVYSQNTAFVLMTASTLVGAAVAMRARLVSIAVLALIGGNLAPLLMMKKDAQLFPFFVYLLAMEVTALFLAWWGGTTRWWTLRGLSVATTAFWALIFTVAATHTPHNVDPRTWPLIFVLIYAGLYQFEVILSAAQQRAGRRTGAVFSFIVTALLAPGVAGIHYESTDYARGAWVAGLAAVCAALGFFCRAASRTESRAGLLTLAIGFAVQAAILLVIAIPVAFSGWAVMSGWAALAVGFAAIGASLDLRVPRRAAAVTWALSLCYFIYWVGQNLDEQRTRTLATIMQTAVPQYLGVAMLLALVGHLVTWIIGRGHRDTPDVPMEMRWWQTLVQATAGVFWVGVSIAALPPLGATVAILLYGWVCGLLDALVPDLRLAWHAAAALALATVKWVIVDLVSDRLSTSATPAAQMLVLNPVMGVGAAIAVSIILIWWLRRRVWAADQPGGAAGSLVVALSVLAIMTAGLTMEVDRAVRQLVDRGTALTFPPEQTRQLAWTMLWCAAAAALVGLVRWLRPAAQVGALAAVAVVVFAAKYILTDTMAFRLRDDPAAANIVFNLQTLAGVFVMALGALGYLLERSRLESQSSTRSVIATVLTLLPWFIITVEVDRWAERQAIAQPWMARQVGWSIWWSIYAIGLVIGGFRLRVAAMRYLGLAMFAITLLKVVLIDMSAASTGLRILSFLGLGVLLLATSVLYGKLSPKLLAAESGGGER